MAAHYERLGFAVLARNLRTTHGELDLVLCRRRIWRRTLVVAVEVKSRRHHGAPERLVEQPELERRQLALAAVCRRLLPSVGRLSVRVDVAAVRLADDNATSPVPEVLILAGSEQRLP